MIPSWVLFVAPAVYLLVSSLISFSINLRSAKKTGLPVVVSPVDHMNPFWVALQKPLRPFLESLPFGLGSFVRYSHLSWYFEDKYQMHAEHGKVFMIVTPGMNELHSVDPAVNSQVFSRKKDFEKPEKILKSVAIYGDSIASVTNADWQRHRRITVPPFNERNCKLVWGECLSQADQLVSYWSEQGSGGIASTTKDIATLALNILATAAMGRSWKFRGAEGRSKAADDEEQEDMDYRACLAYLLRGIRLLVLTPLWVYSLPLAILPKALRGHVSAYRQFEQFMAQIVKEKKAEVAAGQISDDTFLNTIVSKSEEFTPGSKSGGEKGSATGGLSDSEVYGNLFTFNFAGHETTAGSVSYALHLLASHPQVQEWAREEVLYVYKQYEGMEDAHPVYEEAFPQLKRVLVVMVSRVKVPPCSHLVTPSDVTLQYETLRLYNPVNSINKATVGPYGQELTINGRSVLVPPNTMVAPNVIGTCTLPEYWGEDHLDWKPHRWIQEPSPSQAVSGEDAMAAETIGQPPKGRDTFIPWSGGARVCPGKKFSQVEFVAIISRLLRSHRVEVVPRQGETEEAARRRCLEIIKDSETQITLQMRQATSVRLRLVKV